MNCANPAQTPDSKGAVEHRILIAGVGNIFLGDDAFGVEVVRALESIALPEQVQVIDFGTRSYDLAYALTEGYQTVILVDATTQGERPGTTYVIEPALEQLQALEAQAGDAHSMNPVTVLQMAQALGGVRGKLYLVGCEPAVLDSPDGQLGLSEPVREAIPQALRLIHSLVAKSLAQTKTEPGFAPA